MDMELRHLRLPGTIADAGGISRAAALLGYTQQTGSGQLQRIERHFGQPLFERVAVGVRPTEYGVEVLSEAQVILARVKSIGSRRIGNIESPPSNIRLAATNTPILAGMVARIRSRM